MMRFILPFIVFVILAAFLYVGLGLNPREVNSPLIDKPAPAFTLPQLHEPAKLFSPADMKGKVWLLNVWASWCVSCREEHPVLMELARQNIVPVYGLDYKDKNEDAELWLKKGGDPYVLSVSDADGRIGIDYGVYGVPETYVIDKQGVIRYKQIGPVTPQNLSEKILPLVAELQAK
ncbi:thiol:disulfide interchange protein [Ferrigenium kumadai]|uniref:Thiol:disulfide interchange protein n=1 Tax=Ferrigenium kumadai TaxID=1682490 RepID=A0AAN1T1C5_9PROT|nr:DsbE family thiol:disulfide interchange protein [Ferrigenium kumadai]BBI99644.1 thiol:disulfide interchange protein [Ferrigenium kumadai]